METFVGTGLEIGVTLGYQAARVSPGHVRAARRLMQTCAEREDSARKGNPFDHLIGRLERTHGRAYATEVKQRARGRLS